MKNTLFIFSAIILFTGVSNAAFDIHDSDVPVTNRYGYPMLTEIYRFADTTNTPPTKYPVIFCRTQYDRKDDDEANTYTDQGFIYVRQNISGADLSEVGSPGTSVYHFGSFDSETNFVAETYDAIDWIVKQPWCNGRIGMVGGSGNGIGASMGLWCGHTNLIAVNITHSVANFQHYWYFRNGVKRQMFSYVRHRGIDWDDFDWPRPFTRNFKKQRWIDFITERAVSNKVAYFENTGIYDIFNQAAFDNFTALAPYGRAHLTMGEKHHAGTIFYREYLPDGSTNTTFFPSKTKPVFNTSFMDYMNGNVSEGDDASMIRYYLIGDPRDNNSPGNDWKTSSQWPIETISSNFYFYSNGAISNSVPPSGNFYLSYTYNPTNPVFIPGGNILKYRTDSKNTAGPMDQRVLSNRTDVLKFVSPPLTSPLEIIGNIDSTLYISTDVTDTLFVATLVDYNPDGYQAILAQSAIMARYWSGEESPTGLTPNVVYKLDMDMWSTTAILDTGHRIGVHITSSSAENTNNNKEEYNTYEIHPNTYVPVNSYSEAKVAHQNIHLSAEYPSHITLPIKELPIASTNTVVTTTADSGEGSLREILANAANNAEITFNLPSYPSIISLQSTIQITNNPVIIKGRENPADIIINGSGSYRVFNIDKNVSISGLTISNGLVAGNGGGIWVDSDGSFTMSNCVVTSCKANGVQRMGMGLYVGPKTDAAILYSTFCNNTASGNGTDGGAIFFDSATWGTPEIRKIDSCSFYGNETADDGGALQIRNRHETTIINSTFFDNTCADQGGAIASYSPEGSLKIYNCSIVNNHGGTGGGISLFNQAGGTAEIYSSILSNSASVSGANLRDPANFDVIDHCCFAEAPAGNNNVAAQPEVSSSLADNGGPTLTLMPAQTGNCINTGTNILSLSYDQRGPGFTRNNFSATDIGAVEFIPEPVTIYYLSFIIYYLLSKKKLISLC